MVRVAVVGGGIFGCTTAARLSGDGHEVHLYEAKDSLLRCASGINQFRLHRGYHYPRSPETIRECQGAVESFEKEYGPAVIPTGRHYYALARHRSRTTPQQYLKALSDHGLGYRVCSSEHLNMDAVELVVQAADEPWLDVTTLRGLVWDRLKNVSVHLNTKATASLLSACDKIVVAAYASTNAVLTDFGCEPELFQYEVCEKPVLKMPPEFQGVGIVVMDGEFCSLDPLCGTPYHVMGHVRHAIHASNIGTCPEIPDYLRFSVDHGVQRNDRTAWAAFRWAGSDYIPALSGARHIGSMYTVRAVLPNKDDTDERPTLVSKVDDRVIRVFSGKIGTAVSAAEQVASMVHAKEKIAA